MTEAPHNLEAERSVLGAMLVTDVAVRSVLGASGLRAEHFYLERHAAIYAAIVALAATDAPVDPLTVDGELKRRRTPAQEGYVSSLASNVPVAGNAAHYAALVLEEAQLRYQREGGQQIVAGVDARDTDEIRAGLERAASDLRHDTVPVNPSELADEFLEHIESDEPGVVWVTPFGRLNNNLGGGLYPGQITGVIGWPSDGKTTLVDQFIGAFHAQGAACLILATEMTRLERVARFCSNETGIPWKKIRLATLTDGERERVTEALNRIPFGFREIKGWSAAEASVEIAVRRPDVCVLDSIHGLAYHDAGELRQASALLAGAAARVGCHLIHVCQLNMARAKEAYPDPIERDIRDSGALQYDFDNVLSIYRHRNKAGGREAFGHLRLLKVRNGIAGHTVRVQLIRGKYGFEPRKVEREEEPASKPEPFSDDTSIEQLAAVRPVDR